ncbi:MAG: hypothetical protein HYT28_00750 [Parcubacteria group bacterium]|nr:hypothetical protein [Parcubacteria group bacterium]
MKETPNQHSLETKEKEKEQWAEGALREANHLKKDSLEMRELFSQKENAAWGELKKAIIDGEVKKIGTILETHQITDQKEKDKLFDEFSIQEAGVGFAINAINRGEISFYKPEYRDFREYLLPHITKDADFQDAVLKKAEEYINKDDLFEAHVLIKQFIPKEIVLKENIHLHIKQSLIRILENKRFLITDFKKALFNFSDFIPEDALFEPEMQKAAKKAIARLSKEGINNETILPDILAMKALFHID